MSKLNDFLKKVKLIIEIDIKYNYWAEYDNSTKKFKLK
jgi:hypothetical protein